MKKILITGGSGFIGSHTCLLLLEKGYEIHSIDSQINSYPDSLKIIKKINSPNKTLKTNNLFTYQGDIRDNDFLEKIFKKIYKNDKELSGVIHLAGLKSVKDSLHNPLNYWDVNVNGSINLIKIMDKYNCRNIVFSSSAMIYSTKNNGLLKETNKVNPINPYGMTKLAVESFLEEIYKASNNKWRIAKLRYFNPIGAHHSGIIGENPKGISTNLFPKIVEVASGKLKELIIYGKDFPTADGTAIRDYIHIMDIADGHLKALETLLKGKSKIITVNLGTGIGTSVLNLVKIFQKVNNIEVSYKFENRRDGEPPILVADNSLALKLLNWFPKRNIEEMCIDGWNWYKSKPKVF